MVPIPSLARRTRVFVGIAVAGAIPLTLGVIMWVVGTGMGLGSHHGWDGVAGVGLILILAGLLCGVALVIATASWQRGLRRRRRLQRLPGLQALVPAAPPEPQADPGYPGFAHHQGFPVHEQGFPAHPGPQGNGRHRSPDGYPAS